jgi:hypothetical protein
MMSHMQIIISQWLTSLKHYFLMCLLLSSPEHLPCSPYPIVLSGFSYFLLGLLLVDPQRSYGLISAQILLELGMLALVAYSGLAMKRSLQRFPQTFSALLGINVIITAVTIPVYRIMGINGDSSDNMLLYITLVILVWNLAVLSLIFKRAFEVSTHLSAVISFCYFVVFQYSVYWLSS